MFLLQEIEQWVTDAFYSYFPSFSERREEKARQVNEFLNMLFDSYHKGPKLDHKHIFELILPIQT